MDIDAACWIQKIPLACSRCGKVGHFKSECQQGFNIRHLDRDDIEILLEQLNARIDILNLEAAVPTGQLELPQPKELAEEKASDFLTGSR